MSCVEETNRSGERFGKFSTLPRWGHRHAFQPIKHVLFKRIDCAPLFASEATHSFAHLMIGLSLGLNGVCPASLDGKSLLNRPTSIDALGDRRGQHSDLSS